MSPRPFSQAKLHEAFKRSLMNIKLNPKLKAPSKDALPPDELSASTTNDPEFKKQIMGFREWCEKVYEPSRSSNNHLGNAR
jgi:hypothetical protein